VLQNGNHSEGGPNIQMSLAKYVGLLSTDAGKVKEIVTVAVENAKLVLCEICEHLKCYNLITS
jgi:hypothetical protein